MICLINVLHSILHLLLLFENDFATTAFSGKKRKITFVTIKATKKGKSKGMERPVLRIYKMFSNKDSKESGREMESETSVSGLFNCLEMNINHSSFVAVIIIILNYTTENSYKYNINRNITKL